MGGGLEFNHWIEGLPGQKAGVETILGIESSMNEQINALGLGFTYKLSSNEFQDEFTIQIGNIRGNESEEIIFTGTTGESLKAVNNYIISHMKDTHTGENINLNDMPGYRTQDIQELQNFINRAIESVRLNN